MEGRRAQVAGLDQPGSIRGNGAQIRYEMRGSEFSTGGPGQACQFAGGIGRGFRRYGFYEHTCGRSFEVGQACSGVSAWER